MEEKITLANEIVSVTMHFIGCMTFFVIFQILMLGEASPLFMQAMFPLFFGITFAIRLLIKESYLIYVGLHIFLFTTLFLLPHNFLMFSEYVIYLTMLTVHGIAYWRGIKYKANTGFSLIPFTFMCFFYIYAYITHESLQMIILTIGGTIYLLLFLARLYLNGLYVLSHDKINADNMPLSQITLSNSTIIGVILFVAAISLLIADLINADSLLFTLTGGLAAVLSFIGSIIAIFFKWISCIFGGEGMFAGMADLFDKINEEANKNNIVARIIDIIFALIFIAIAIFITSRIFKIIYGFASSILKKNNLSTDTIEMITRKKKTPLIIEKLKPQKKKEPISKIRRQYKKEIEAFGKKLVLTKAMTCGDIEAQMTEAEASKLKDLKEAYEKERYFEEK
ncbi:MAG: hypothetical protein IKQ71_06760 [Lachnospiraceae bacterium]|nr:hypothetical protein [Lachnospiraceae bacterium]